MVKKCLQLCLGEEIPSAVMIKKSFSWVMAKIFLQLCLGEKIPSVFMVKKFFQVLWWRNSFNFYGKEILSVVLWQRKSFSWVMAEKILQLCHGEGIPSVSPPLLRGASRGCFDVISISGDLLHF